MGKQWLERHYHQSIKADNKLEKYLELMSQWAYWQSARCKLRQNLSYHFISFTLTKLKCLVITSFDEDVG